MEMVSPSRAEAGHRSGGLSALYQRSGLPKLEAPLL